MGEKRVQMVDIFLFAGQSNMAGRGVTSGQWPQPTPDLMKGAGYEFRAISDPSKLYPVEEPFGVDENKIGGICDIFSSGVKAKTGSMVTAFCNAYYEKTGVPIVGVSASKGGSRLNQWLPGSVDGFLEDTIGRYCSAEKFLQENSYEIRHRYMLWCQGESDGDKGTTAEEYKQKFLTLWQEIKQAGVEKCFLVQTGKKNVPGEEEAYAEIQRAQRELCDSRDIIMASTCLASMQQRGLMKDAFHYYQQAYNECGTDAGKTVGTYVAEKCPRVIFDK